ncbi:MAG: YbjN domain-containing protein [Faecousia sp.]
MVHKATQEIAQMLESRNFKFDTIESDTSSRLICGINGKYVTYKIQFISLDDDNDVAVRAFDLVKFPEEKKTDMILFANECNSKYRFVKFVVNGNDNTLQLEVDLPSKNEEPAEIAFEMLIRILRIMDEMGADMMRRVWA